MKRCLKIGSAAIFATVISSAASATSLSAPAQDAILRALDDEYHAEAVYAATLAKFGDVPPFNKIIEAERQHQSALLGLMKTYGIAVPQNPYTSGEKSLTALPDTLLEVCAIGVAAEIENASLYDDELLPAVAMYPDITRVFRALSDASTNKHLPAFQRCAEGKGGKKSG
jgi:hypothetical protein